MRAVALIACGFIVAGVVVGAVGCKPPVTPKDTRPDEILALWTQIRDFRREAGLPVEPRREDVISVVGTPVREVQRVCKEDHDVPQVCNDVCSLADAICDNAEQICILAADLGKGDSWAQDKCSSAKASCREAKKKCCGCSETKPDAKPEGKP